MEDELLALVDRELDSRAARNAATTTTTTIEMTSGYPDNGLPIIGAEHLRPVRSSVLRTSFRNYVRPYDPSLLTADPAQTLRNSSTEARRDILAMTNDIPGTSSVDETVGPNLPYTHLRTPEPQFRNLLSDWRPSKKNRRCPRGEMKTYFEFASRAIENKSGIGPGIQYPSQHIYSQQWNNEVTTLLSRRAKVVIYGEITGNDYTSLLAMNREDLIEYFHGNVQRADSLLNWWQEQ